MNHYLFQMSYTNEAWQSLMENPHNRVEVVRPIIQKMGGDILASWLCPSEDYHLVAVLDLPDEETATAALIAFKAGGALREAKCARLVSWEEGIRSMRTAWDAHYQPPGAMS